MQGTAASDSELLDCFVKERDSAAFRNLVVRHGPMVLQVCRAVLQDPHALTAILLGFTGSTALAFHGRPVPDVDPTTLPSNLTDVLNVDCS
jgi:hypothetical protein